MADQKRFLLVEEQGEGTRGAPPLVLEIMKETTSGYVTGGLFAVGLQDLTPSFRSKGVVRWLKKTMMRSGEDKFHPRFLIKKVIAGEAEAMAVPRAFVVEAETA